MKISNRTLRNISCSLMILGILITIFWGLEVIKNPSSGKAWFELCGIMVLTYLQSDSFISYRKRVKDGIIYGSTKPIAK